MLDLSSHLYVYSYTSCGCRNQQTEGVILGVGIVMTVMASLVRGYRDIIIQVLVGLFAQTY